MAIKARSGWGRWRWLHERKCAACGRVWKILGNDTRHRPGLGSGAIRCDCGGLVRL